MFSMFTSGTLVGPWEMGAEANDRITVRVIEGARMGMLATHTEPVRGAIDAFIGALD